MRAVLWGKDHVELDEVVVERLGARAAVAITRGRHRKPYRYTDPNEDAAAAVVGPRATLLAVADGHNGWPATEAAINTVVEGLGADPPPADLDDAALIDLFHCASQAILEVTTHPDSRNPDSRTTLAVALVAPGRLQWASFGDSAVYRVTAGGAAALSAPQHRFVGYPMPRYAVDHILDRGTAELGEDTWVVVASDGFVDYAQPFPTGLFNGDVDAADAAHGLVMAACEGGAGDNVAVAVCAPCVRRE